MPTGYTVEEKVRPKGDTFNIPCPKAKIGQFKINLINDAYETSI